MVTFAIGLVAPLDEANAVLGEISQRIEYWIQGVHNSILFRAEWQTEEDRTERVERFALLFRAKLIWDLGGWGDIWSASPFILPTWKRNAFPSPLPSHPVPSLTTVSSLHFSVWREKQTLFLSLSLSKWQLPTYHLNTHQPETFTTINISSCQAPFVILLNLDLSFLLLLFIPFSTTLHQVYLLFYKKFNYFFLILLHDLAICISWISNCFITGINWL